MRNIRGHDIFKSYGILNSELVNCTVPCYISRDNINPFTLLISLITLSSQRMCIK